MSCGAGAAAPPSGKESTWLDVARVMYPGRPGKAVRVANRVSSRLGGLSPEAYATGRGILDSACAGRWNEVRLILHSRLVPHAVHTRDTVGCTLLHHAAGFRECVRPRLRRLPKWRQHTRSAVEMAAAVAHVQYLLRFGADPNAASVHGDTPLVSAVRARSPGTLRALLEGGADLPLASPSALPLFMGCLWWGVQDRVEFLQVR